MHLVKLHGCGVPERSRDAFDFLQGAGLLDESLTCRLKKMVGFRNIAIHQYQELDPGIVEAIIVSHLTDFREFIAAAIKAATKGIGE